MPRSEPLPQPPPAERTAGQLVAETIRFYQENFWRVLPLGLAVAAIDQVTPGFAPLGQALILLAGAPLVTGAYVAAASLATGKPPTRTAFALGLVIWIPVPALTMLFILPAVAWLALVGLAVPAAVAERLSFREGFARGRRLGSADFVHALGSLATLVLVFGLTKFVLVYFLRNQGDATQRTAFFLADLVLSPVLFVGAALLYFDQVARLESTRSDRVRSRNADSSYSSRS
jgi:hypothetical protein